MQAASKELLPTEVCLKLFPLLSLFKNWSLKNGSLLKMEQAKRALLGQLISTSENLFTMWKSEICVPAQHKGSQTLVPPFYGRCPNC